MSDPLIPELVEAYLTELAESQRPPNTIRAYNADLTPFVKFLATEAERKCTSATHLKSIDHTDISEYMEDIYRKNKISTAARALSAIGGWFKFLGRKGYITHNPVEDMERPSIPENLPRIPSVDKANDLCNSVSYDNSSWPARDRAILELLYGCGVLVSELVNLDLQSVNLNSKYILVQGREGRLPLGDCAAEALTKYLPERTAQLNRYGDKTLLSAEPLFLNIQLRNLRNPSIRARLTTRSVGRIVKDIAVRCGLSSGVNPRALRIAYAAHMLDEGAELHHVQQLIGHHSAATTMRVKKLAKAALKKVIDRTHPRA